MPSTLLSHPKIIFMGTPEFALPALKALVQQNHDVEAVVTQPDRPKGRGRALHPPAVKRLALSHGIQVLQPDNASAPEFCELIRAKKPDLLVVIAFGQILRKNLLEIPPYGVLNIHASLLPKYRGAAPIQWAIFNNEKKTGLTAMRMDEGMDTGPILFQQEISISQDETAGELHDRLSQMAGDFLIDTLNLLMEGRLEERPQDHNQATYAPKIHRDMASINWDKPANIVSALIRGLDPWPGAFTIWKGRQIKLFCPRIMESGLERKVPGRVAGRTERGLQVETRDGIVEVGEFQVPGKKRMPSVEFLRGFSLPDGTLFGK